jgi:uncharacterized membrane protein YhaH (DUF805 family)
MFVLFNVIFAIAAAVIDNVIGLAFGDTGYGPFYLIYNLVVLIPTIAVMVRRLHDIGKSGWFILLGLIPCVGGIILLVFTVMAGDAYDNEYGPDPKADEYTSGLF